jgi:ImpA, N-terminal, type VI secretion system
MWLANAERALYDCTVTLAVFMIEVEQLLKPVSVKEPCGKNLSYDPGFLALEGLIAGKPETQFSAAEEPNLKAVRDACLALLGQSKDLRVAVTLCLALVKLEGAKERWFEQLDHALCDGGPERFRGRKVGVPTGRCQSHRRGSEGLTVSLRLVTKLPSVKAGAS